MKETYKIVSKQGKNRDMQHRNSSSRFSLSLQPGDQVLIRNMSQRGGRPWFGKTMSLFQE